MFFTGFFGKGFGGVSMTKPVKKRWRLEPEKTGKKTVGWRGLVHDETGKKPVPKWTQKTGKKPVWSETHLCVRGCFLPNE